MSKVAGIPLLFWMALQMPLLANAQVSKEYHELCKEAKDYLGCIKAMRGDEETSSPSRNMSVDIDMIRTTGNTCPSTMAYTGAGYCEKIICVVNYSGHDSRLGGKGWSCGRGYTLQFSGTPIRATTDERCPLVEPEIGKNNSCQNGLSEEELKSGYFIREYKADTRKRFGYLFDLIDGERAIEILRVIPGCAMAKAGFIKGDKITSINGRSFSIGKNPEDRKFILEQIDNEKPSRFNFERDNISYRKTVSPFSCTIPATRVKLNSNTGEVIHLD